MSKFAVGIVAILIKSYFFAAYCVILDAHLNYKEGEKRSITAHGIDCFCKTDSLKIHKRVSVETQSDGHWAISYQNGIMLQ